MEFEFDHQLLNRNTFGLVEPAMVEYLPEGIVTEPIVPPMIAASAHLMPRVLDLVALSTDTKAGLLNTLFDAQRHGEQPIVSMFVQTSMTAQEFILHWNGMQVAAPAPGRKVWLRLHDPRVLHQLLRILTPAQQKKLFGKIASFSYWVGDAWITMGADDIGQHERSGSASGQAWDWPRIEQIGLVNRALLGAGIHRAAEMRRCGELAEQLISRARERHALSEQADLVEFAMRGLSTSLRFDDHPDVLRAIPASSDPDDDSRLADRLALIDDNVWAEMGHAVTKE